MPGACDAYANEITMCQPNIVVTQLAHALSMHVIRAVVIIICKSCIRQWFIRLHVQCYRVLLLLSVFAASSG